MRRARVALLAQGGPGWMGGSIYVRNWARALESVPDLEVTLFQPESPEPPSELDPLRRGVRRARDFVRRTSARLAESPHDALARAGYEFAFPHFPRRVSAPKLDYAAWIPDFQHFRMPDYFPPWTWHRIDQHLRAMTRRARRIVLSSRAARDDLAEYAPAAVARATVLHFHTIPSDTWYDADPVATQRAHGLPDRFFLVSNQFWQHKNHETLLRAVAALSDLGVTLVATGALRDDRAPGYAHQVQAWIRELHLEGSVRLLGLIPRIDQIQLMRRAVAVVQPSLFEGWSTVVEDARALGVPVVASAIAVHREQLGPDADLFPPRHPGALAERLREAWRAWDPGPHCAAERRAREEAPKLAASMAEGFRRLVLGPLL